MNMKKFELNVLISLVNGTTILNVTQQAKKELVEFVLGKEVQTKDWNKAVDKVVTYLTKKYEAVVKAAQLVADTILDQGRYNRLVDLYKKFHEIQPMPVRSPKAAA